MNARCSSGFNVPSVPSVLRHLVVELPRAGGIRPAGALLRWCFGLFALCAGLAVAAPQATPTDPATVAATELIDRILPGAEAAFVCELIPADHDRDVYEYEAGNDGKIILRGNNAGALAVAFCQYLRREARLDYGWQAAGPLTLAGPLPRPAARVRRFCRVPERFFLNYCTYGYTFPWWGWTDWERLLDWMAMNGINRPLLQAGQEAVWLRVWESYGMGEAEVLGYFSAPAHLPWHRMANLDRWGGPLPRSFVEGQMRLQQRILARARALGMKPVLAGFAGHVPAELRRLRPQAKISAIKPGWSGMAAAYATDYLDPQDPLFAEIQGRFLRTQAELYGTDHLYAADPFNETQPLLTFRNGPGLVWDRLSLSEQYRIDGFARFPKSGPLIVAQCCCLAPVAKARQRRASRS